MNPHLALNVLLLPIDIYYCIQEFTSINSFLNTSKRLGDVKRILFYWKLGRSASKRFQFIKTFRTQLLDLVHRSKNQLLLNLAHSLELTDVSALGHVHTLKLVCFNVSDASALGHVYMLDLSGCTNVSDVSALGHVHTLNLGWCDNVSDVRALGHVHTLSLRECCTVSDW
jgi:hypothetical protein